MSSIKQLEDALIQADLSGDIQSAQMFADEIKRIKSSEAGVAAEDDEASFASGLGSAALQGLSFGFSDEAPFDN